jgi:rhodanese-related sulfurtransferase
MRNQSKRKRSEADGGGGSNGKEDQARNDDARNNKKKERKKKQRHEEEETAATTMKHATPCTMEETEQSGGESTAELVEKCDELTTDAAVTSQSSERREKRTKKEKKAAKEKKKKKKKKDAKKKKKELSNSDQDSDSDIDPSKVSEFEKKKALDPQHLAESKALTGSKNRGKIVASSAIEFYNEEIKRERKEDIDDNKTKRAQEVNKITLLLFYTYVEPVWDEATYNFMLKTLQEVGERLQLTGRMRVAKEGVNCTLTGTQEAIVEYCTMLRKLRPKEFENTEFKLTHDLPLAQKFPNLKVFKVVELVHYGLEGSKAPPIAKYQGTHLEPKDYHEMLAEKDTVVIDVRNHYEAAIGRFAPPNSEWLDPKMRKSTEFPVWLDKPETKEMMRGKQVMMYCTGGIRCERGKSTSSFF